MMDTAPTHGDSLCILRNVRVVHIFSNFRNIMLNDTNESMLEIKNSVYSQDEMTLTTYTLIDLRIQEEG